MAYEGIWFLRSSVNGRADPEITPSAGEHRPVRPPRGYTLRRQVWKRTVGGLEEPRGSLTVRDVKTRPWVGGAICTMVRFNWNLIAPQCKCPWEMYVAVTSAVLDFKDAEERV